MNCENCRELIAQASEARIALAECQQQLRAVEQDRHEAMVLIHGRMSWAYARGEQRAERCARHIIAKLDAAEQDRDHWKADAHRQAKRAAAAEARVQSLALRATRADALMEALDGLLKAVERFCAEADREPEQLCYDLGTEMDAAVEELWHSLDPARAALTPKAEA